MGCCCFRGPDAGAKGAIEDDELLRTEVARLVREFEVESGESCEDPETRFSLIGSTIDKGTLSFASKQIVSEGKDFDFNESGIGYTCRKGLKPLKHDSPNQDSWFIFKHEKFSIYAVLDGHGKKGHEVSDWVKRMLPKLILKDPRSRTLHNWGEVLTDAFIKLQGLMVNLAAKMKLGAYMSGTTATVAIHDHQTNKITVGHVADSTAVQGHKKVDGTYSGVAITRDHKPELEDESARIERAGGRVVFDGQANHRVYAGGNANYPGLNMSRSLGDLLGHTDCGISCEPEISIFEVEPGKEQFLLICSDGVWQFIEPNAAVTQVAKSLASETSAQVAADVLAKDAWDQWLKQGGEVVDDITVIFVQLGKGGSRCDQ